MSELKAYIGPAPDEKGLADYYLKSESDKVIARHKYKRCLDNAWWCRKSNKAYAWSASNLRGWKIAVYYDKKAELYRKWHKRWLELAKEPTWAKFLQLIHKECK